MLDVAQGAENTAHAMCVTMFSDARMQEDEEQGNPSRYVLRCAGKMLRGHVPQPDP